MPTNRITIRQIRETLRLHLCARLSFHEVGRSLKIPKSAAAKYASLARAANVDWAIAQHWTRALGSTLPFQRLQTVSSQHH